MNISVLSLWQPWASLIAFGEKRIETRSWKWPRDLPGVLAIHAAMKWDKQLQGMSLEEPFRAALALHGIEFIGARRQHGNLPFGQIVAIVRIVECVATTSALSYPCLANQYLRELKNERAFGDYSYGRYAWVFDRLECLKEPVRTKGHQGLFNWEMPAEISAVAESWMKLEAATA